MKYNGVTTTTPDNMLLGAGAIYTGLAWNDTSSAFEGSLYGATKGGNKYTHTLDIFDPELDGQLVKAKGLSQKIGEAAMLEINMAQLSSTVLAHGLLGDIEVASVTGFDKITTRAKISDGDYIENLGFVGEMTNGKPIVIILGQALCTNGVEVEGKNKENAVMTQTFECMAEIDDETNLATLPVSIYYPVQG